MATMTKEKASEMLDSGYHCSQCVMEHGAELLGLDPELAKKYTSGLGGGCFSKGTIKCCYEWNILCC